jgi:hypothetical protein
MKRGATRRKATNSLNISIADPESNFADNINLSETVKSETVKSETVKADTVKADTVKAETVKAETVKAETVKAETVKAETVKAETVKAEIVKAETVKAETVKAETERNHKIIKETNNLFLSLSYEFKEFFVLPDHILYYYIAPNGWPVFIMQEVVSKNSPFNLIKTDSQELVDEFQTIFIKEQQIFIRLKEKILHYSSENKTTKALGNYVLFLKDEALKFSEQEQERFDRYYKKIENERYAKIVKYVEKYNNIFSLCAKYQEMLSNANYQLNKYLIENSKNSKKYMLIRLKLDEFESFVNKWSEEAINILCD